jgi:spore maturation protein CgeB
VERLLCAAARALPERRFCVAGPQYPVDIDWPANVERIDHVPPAEHADFYAASRFTLNVTRADMIAAGWSPSVRLFEAALCGCPIISDIWEGLDELFTPGREILLARGTEDVVAALEGIAPDKARSIGEAARSRVLADHTAAVRAAELERHLEETMVDKPAGALANRRGEGDYR